MRNAGESVCVLVESFSESIDGELTRDEIRTISANVLQVIDAVIRPVVMGDTIKFVCHIKVSVEKENVLNYIKANSKTQIDDATRRIKELEEENRRIREENERIKNQFKTADAAERKRLNEEIKLNEKKFTALQYTEQGENYYTKRQYNKAIEALNKAIEIAPKLQLSWSSLGYVYLSAGNKSKAEESFNKTVGLLREQLKFIPKTHWLG